MNPGEILDNRYEIIARLGAGGMGEVYKATHLHLGATRVIKVVHPNISGNTDAKDRFLREARAATRVHHQNVATLHDFSSLTDGSHYMVWEYIDGENLAQKLRARGTLPPRQAVHIIIEALHGLDAIHRAGIIHRDISPENLMISREDEQVKIIDLGVAKVEDNEVSQTRTGIFVGKLRYAAPEQLGFLPEGEKVDGRVDIYAAAMVLVELLTGRPPYEAKSPHEYFILHASQAPPKAIELPADLPGRDKLLPVLERALARNRNERFTTAREFAYALEDIEKSLPNPRDMATMALPYDGDETMRVTPSPTKPDTLHRETVITSAKTEALTPAPSATQAVPPPPPAPQPAAQAAPTILTPLPQAFPPQAATPKQGSMAPLIILGVILLLLAGAIGALVLQPWKKKTTDVAQTTTSNTATTTTQTTTQPPQVAASTVDVNLSSTTTTNPVTTTTAPTATIVENTQTVAPPPHQTTTTPKPTKPPEVVENKPPKQDEGTSGDESTSGEDDNNDVGPSDGFSSGATYVDGGDEGSNDRALAMLRRELRGTREVSVRAGAQTLDLARALRAEFPSLKFTGEANVIIRFDGRAARGRFGRKTRGGVGTISKNGRVVFRYEMPNEIYRVGDTSAEAFARVIAEAMNE